MDPRCWLGRHNLRRYGAKTKGDVITFVLYECSRCGVRKALPFKDRDRG